MEVEDEEAIEEGIGESDKAPNQDDEGSIDSESTSGEEWSDV